MVLEAFKQKINIKYFMAVYLAAVFIFASFSFAGPGTFVKGCSVVFLYAMFDLIWTFLRDKAWYFPLSSLISGLVLAIVAGPDLPVPAVVLLPLLAVFSKQLLHFGRMRHVFNPAAFGMAVMGFFLPVVSWWATGWNLLQLFIVALVSIFILWKQQRFHVAVPFLVCYSVLLLIFLLISGVNVQNLQQIFMAQFVTGTLLFFSTVMLIEPLTSTFPTRRQRVLYGLLVAIFSITFMTILRFVHIGNQDPLLLGLLCGNLTASLFFLPKVKKNAAKVQN